MIRYPMVIPGAHPAAGAVFDQDVYVEALPNGPIVGFAVVGTQLWVDMPVEAISLLNDKDLNPQYHYLGRLVNGHIVLTDIGTSRALLDHEAKFVEADRLGMECVQLLHAGSLESPEQIQGFFEQSPDGLMIKPVTLRPGRPVVHVEVGLEMFNDSPISQDGGDANASDSHA